MAATTFEEYQSSFAGRHEHPLAGALSTAGDALWLAAAPAGVATRSGRVFVGVFMLGTVVATSAHLFGGTVRQELAAVLRHPGWAARAEVARVASTLSGAGSRSDTGLTRAPRAKSAAPDPRASID